ncbi:hypothetical protein ACS0TY_035084 [Phlomoides rotata]
MKYNRARVCGSKSSTNVVTHIHGVHGAGNSNETTEFVNHGLLLWNQGRQKWIGRRKAEHRSRLFRVPKLRNWSLCMAKRFWLCSVNTPDNRCLKNGIPFPKPIPLSEMVDFLVDIWEQEGM